MNCRASLFSLLLTLVIPPTVQAQTGQVQTSQPQAARTGNWAERMFSEKEHDFGVVTKGSDARHKIDITNIFGEPITLHGVTSSCGCTVPTLSTRVLQPGEVGQLELKLNTVQFSKQKSPNVDVRMSFGNSSMVTVRVPVRAYIRDDVTTSVDVVDFGVVGEGEAATKTVTVTYHGYAPWRITGVQDANKGITAEVSKPTRTSQGVVYQVNLTLSPELPVGTVERSLIVLTEEPSRSYLPLRIRAAVEPDVVVATPVVQLGTMNPGAVSSTRLIIRGRKPFAIENVEGIPGTVSADLGKATPKTVHVLPVKITAPEVAGKFSQDLRITLGGNRPAVTCRVEGEVLSQPTSSGLAGN